MTISNAEKMDLLLKQIELPEQIKEAYFEASSLEKVIVYKKEKRWHLHIKINNVLPFEIYFTFLNQLKQSFQSIADIRLILLTENQHCEADEFQFYWSYFVQSLSKLLPSHIETLEQQPIINENNIQLTISTDAEAASLQKKLEKSFQRFCEACGLRKYTLQFEVKAALGQLENFRKQTIEEDKQIVINAVKAQKERQGKNGIDIGKQQLFKVGSAIQEEPVNMEEIIEEERRITVQ